MKEDSSGYFEGNDIMTDNGYHDSPDYLFGEEIYSSEKGFVRIHLVRRLGRLFIAKSLLPKYRDDLVAKAALRKEFQIGFSVDSPGVVRTFDFSTHPEYGSFIVLEYCRGIDLSQLIGEDCQLSGKELLKIADSLISTLRILHLQGIIHRDIKPSNIIFDQVSSSVKLIDFGCADTFDQLMFKGRAGTELYQSEAFINTPSADWYALSLCLSELLEHCSDRAAVEKVASLCAIMRKGIDPQEAKPVDTRSRKRTYLFILSLLAIVSLVCVIFYTRNQDPVLVKSDKSNKTVDLAVGMDTLIKKGSPMVEEVEEKDSLPLSPDLQAEESPAEKIAVAIPKMGDERKGDEETTSTIIQSPATKVDTSDLKVKDDNKLLLPPEEMAVGMSRYVADSIYNNNIGFLHNRVRMACSDIIGERKIKEKRMREIIPHHTTSLRLAGPGLWERTQIKSEVYDRIHRGVSINLPKDTIMKIIDYYVRAYF